MSRSQSQALRIAIAGGGIGGLSAAVALRQAGLDVTVYEQASALGEVGAGVGLAPNGMRMYEYLGLRRSVESVGAKYGEGSGYYRSDGAFVGEMTNTDSSKSYYTFGVHRADLVRVLAGELGAERVKTASRLIAVAEDGDGVTLRFADGEEAAADVVVGADGIHSVVREYVVPEIPEPVSSGSIAYRGVLDARLIGEWPPNVASLWMGEGKHFLTYPVRRGLLMNYVGFVPSDEKLKESWSAVGDADSLRAEFAGWDDRISTLLEAVSETFWWGLYDREPLPFWTRGHATLLGDAAHAMLPHLGQGANQAIEDGVVLAHFLRGLTRGDDVRGALSRYEDLRRERTGTVQRNARANGRRYDSDYDDLQIRDREIQESSAIRRWIYDYDALNAAKTDK